MELARQQLDLKDIDQDLYIVAAINDHIVLWTSSYATIHHVSGHARFVLSNGGHIAGIVNPPSPRAWYEVAEDNPEDPQQWRGRRAAPAGLVVGRLGEIGVGAGRCDERPRWAVRSTLCGPGQYVHE